MERHLLEKKSSELLALQAQINPHFLFNTIETINWKVVSLNGFDCDASRMLQNLSCILKYSVYNSKDKVPLYEEIDNARRYVEIMRLRYAGKFSVVWSETAEVSEYPVIKMLIQPLIENSIYHGIKEKSGVCIIKVKARLTGGNLRIAVIDNGVGISRSILRSLRSKLESDQPFAQSHIGLLNTSKRLRLTYGDRFQLTVRSSLGKGTSVSIEIPACGAEDAISASGIVE